MGVRQDAPRRRHEARAAATRARTRHPQQPGARHGGTIPRAVAYRLRTTEIAPEDLRILSPIARLHITPYIGHVPIQKLSPQHLQKWINLLGTEGWRRKRTKADEATGRPNTRGIAPRTILYARAILRAALAQAMRWNIVPQTSPR
jgi:hypothetical protein